MTRPPQEPAQANRPRLAPWLGAVFQMSLLLALALLFVFFLGANLWRFRVRTRGLETDLAAEQATPAQSRLGTNVALERYPSEDTLRQALRDMHAAGLGVIRQRFAWQELEPAPGHYRWERWDWVLPIIHQEGLTVIATIDTSPVWAREEWESDNAYAPPHDMASLATFATALAGRYGEWIMAYQIWDEPNIAPHWGNGPIDPAEYVAMLRAASAAIRQADPDAIIIGGGMAPNLEPGGRNMSDVQFLHEIYRRGAGQWFDVLGIKAYGFWSGPYDRRVDPSALNLSRVILLREEMVRRGEKAKPMWSLEGGWCALPDDWQGRPSPQGSDTPFVQAERTTYALQRLQQEWPWMGLFLIGHWQPLAMEDDPLWGYALHDPRGQQNLLLQRLERQRQQDDLPYPGLTPAQQLQFDLWRALLGGALALGWLGVSIYRTARLIPWRQAWLRVGRWWSEMPSWVQVSSVVAPYAVLMAWPSPTVRTVCLLVYGLASLLRPDLALGMAVAAIPLAPLIVRLPRGSFSLTEICLLVAVASRLWNVLLGGRRSLPARTQWSLLDGAVVALLLWGLGSSFLAEYRRVALREWRTVVLESAALYGLLRTWDDRRWRRLQLADVLWLSAVAVSAYALLLYPFPAGVIEAEGVRRARAFYGSPNNLALYLDRVFPLGLAMIGWSRTRWRRWLYGLGSILMALAILLTFSRGAWFLGIPAGLLALAWARGGRARWLALGLVTAGVLVVITAAGTERISSLFDLASGTTFLRISLWRASWDMLKDHPWLGIGLDNFLYYYGDYIRSGAEVDRWLSHPHNIVLDYWLRLGIGGVMILLTMVVGFFRHARKSFRKSAHGRPEATAGDQGYHDTTPDDQNVALLGMAAGMVAVLAHGLIDSAFFVVELAFWFMFALAQAQRHGEKAPVTALAPSPPEPSDSEAAYR